jgi:hypothetical protein
MNTAEFLESCSEALDAFNEARASLRLRQLLDVAREGKTEAIGDLWREYQFLFGDEPHLASSSQPHVEQSVKTSLNCKSKK